MDQPGKIIEQFIYEQGDVLYIGFLYLSLVVVGLILARQKPRPQPGPDIIVVHHWHVVPPPPPVLSQPPRLAPRDTKQEPTGQKFTAPDILV